MVNASLGWRPVVRGLPDPARVDNKANGRGAIGSSTALGARDSILLELVPRGALIPSRATRGGRCRHLRQYQPETKPSADFKAKTPLIGMTMVFAAMTIVAFTAYMHYGWYSIIGYAIAAAIAV